MANSLPDNVFRANVGALIINDNGQTLAFERNDIKDAWQLPQGGIDIGEEPIDALFREIKEETCINKSALKLIDEHPEWLAYELSKEKRSNKTGRGQVQKWFLLRFTGYEKDIDPENAVEHEFTAWKWTTLKKLTEKTAPFRKNIYKRLEEYFAEYLE